MVGSVWRLSGNAASLMTIIYIMWDHGERNGVVLCKCSFVTDFLRKMLSEKKAHCAFKCSHWGLCYWLEVWLNCYWLETVIKLHDSSFMQPSFPVVICHIRPTYVPEQISRCSLAFIFSCISESSLISSQWHWFPLVIYHYIISASLWTEKHSKNISGKFF